MSINIKNAVIDNGDTVNIGDTVKTHWGDGTVIAMYKHEGLTRSGDKVVNEWVDVEINGLVCQMPPSHIEELAL